MPKYLKDTKIKIYSLPKSYHDNVGLFHQKDPELLGEFWAHVSGIAYETKWAAGAYVNQTAFSFTITRPSFDIEPGFSIIYKGRQYLVKEVDELTAHPHTDFKFIAYFDNTRQELVSAS